MAENIENKEAVVDVQQTMDKAELFFDKNKKTIGYFTGAVIAVVTLVLAYNMWYIPEQNKEAQTQIFVAQSLFEKDSFNLALKGGNYNGTTFTGLEEVSETYASTPTGKVAKYMVGVSYLQLGKFNEAIESLEGFSSDDILLTSIATGAIGDAKMELNQIDEAIKYYEKAADINTNNFTTPIYLKKAALAYESKSQFADALKLYERIQKEFSKTTEARDIEKYIMRAKTLGNI